MGLTAILILAFQILCIVHVVSKDKPVYWVVLIIVLPLVGCIAYIATQMIQKSDVQNAQSNLNTIINPGSKIRDLEKKVRISDSVDNKVALADAYLENQRVDEAITMYETSLKGVFKEDPYVLMQLGLAYFELREFEEAVKKLSIVSGHIDFKRSKSHLAYAFSLDELGRIAEARKEFERMNARHSHIEFRYHYAIFLANHNEVDTAKSVLNGIESEVATMDTAKKQRESKWIKKASSLLAGLEQ